MGGRSKVLNSKAAGLCSLAEVLHEILSMSSADCYHDFLSLFLTLAWVDLLDAEHRSCISVFVHENQRSDITAKVGMRMVARKCVVKQAIEIPKSVS